ncbi:hypothetical protein, partial [Psychrobacillus sp. BL-248-WT-3]|uniref:hypothetical protein n=1 Tax=Psychrobacillus sp. BL-248-WT-3 TaxID=2725306 RepID=UPI00197E4F6A
HLCVFPQRLQIHSQNQAQKIKTLPLFEKGQTPKQPLATSASWLDNRLGIIKVRVVFFKTLR